VRAARFSVSWEVIRDALHMPATCSLLWAKEDAQGRLKLVVGDPALPEAEEPHESNPTITRIEHAWEWGIES
jgi:hypothetical protein